MFFLLPFLLGNFPFTLADSLVPGPGKTLLELEKSSLSECTTTSSATKTFSECHSDEITQYKAVFITNAAAIILVGAPTNLITLVALPYVRLRYPDEVPDLNTNKAILILHLSLTDFLYCVLGLPFILATLQYGYFPASASLCSFSALLRNLISYADFFTMAAIALISSIGLLISDRNFYTKFSKTPITLAICAGIWLVAFAIISPIIFDINLFGENFGQFGWNPEAARCGVTYSENVGEDSTHRKVIFACGVIVPFLVISVSYGVLGLFHRRNHGDASRLTGMHVTMLRLCFAYAIFTAPRVFAHMFYKRLGMTPFKSMILYSWYCWMYSINVIIYVVSSSEFRKVYKIFFEDVFHGFANLWRKFWFLRTSETETSAIELYTRKDSHHGHFF